MAVVAASIGLLAGCGSQVPWAGPTAHPATDRAGTPATAGGNTGSGTIAGGDAGANPADPQASPATGGTAGPDAVPASPDAVTAGPAPDNPAPANPAPKDDRPVVGNLQMSPANVACTYVPHGNIDGTDSLTIFAYVLIIGANDLPGPLSNTMSITTNGYSAAFTGGPSNGSSQPFSGPIRSGDWGQAMVVRIVTDANDRYRETDEGDNAIVVRVALPATRPYQTVDRLSCSAERA
jgi:hypothetical protein